MADGVPPIRNCYANVDDGCPLVPVTKDYTRGSS